MKLSMDPDQIGAYREKSNRDKPMNHASRMCNGPCKHRHSAGQFEPGDDICKQCRRRMPKTQGDN